jgi:hypothetical protein
MRRSYYEAPFAPRGLPARGPAPHAGHNRNAGRQLALVRSHIPKDGCQAPVTLRYSDIKSQCCIANLPQTDCFFSGTPYLDLEVDHAETSGLDDATTGTAQAVTGHRKRHT